VARGQAASFAARDQRLEAVVGVVLPAATRHHLVARVGEAVLAPELLADGVLQLGGAADRSVLREPARQRLARGRLDVLRRLEIGLAGRQVDDVASLGTQGRRLGRQAEGRGGLDAAHARGELEGHDRRSRTRASRRARTWSGSSPATLPPRLATSFTRRELM